MRGKIYTILAVSTAASIAAAWLLLMLSGNNHDTSCGEATMPRTLPDGGVFFPPTPEECR